MIRTILGVFLVIVIVEGAIRKWLLPEYSNEVFALKDLVLFACLFAYAMQHQATLPKSPDILAWFVWAVLMLGYAAIAGFSFESIVGLRYYLAPLPLIVVLPAVIREPEFLERAAAWAVRLAIPIGILAVIQFYSPADSALNAYAWGGEEVGSTFGVGDDILDVIDRPRVTATFSYISTYAAFLSAAWVLAWISILHGRKRFDQWLAAGGLILISFNMGMNGSRALLVIAAITGFPFLMALMRKLGSIRSQLIALAIIVASGFVGTSILEPFVLTSERSVGPEEIVQRISGTLLTPYVTLTEIDFLGEGMGSTFGGYEQLGYRTATAWDEVNLDRVGIELGIVGYLYLLVLKILMLAKAWGVYRRASSEDLRHWALAALLIQLSSVWQIPFYNAVAAIYYFCAVGLVYWLDQYERQGAGVQRRSPADAALERAMGARGYK